MSARKQTPPSAVRIEDQPFEIELTWNRFARIQGGRGRTLDTEAPIRSTRAGVIRRRKEFAQIHYIIYRKCYISRI